MTILAIAVTLLTMLLGVSIWLRHRVSMLANALPRQKPPVYRVVRAGNE